MPSILPVCSPVLSVLSTLPYLFPQRPHLVDLHLNQTLSKREMLTFRQATMGGSSSKQADSHKGKGKSTDQSIQEVAEHRDRAIQTVQTLRAQFRSDCSHPGCKETLPPLDYDKIFDAWLAGSQTVPPQSQFSTWSCKQGHSTCVGCGGTPKLNSESLFTSLGVVNHCCDAGRLFTIWFLLAQFDKLTLESETNSEKKNKADPKPKTKSKSKAKASTHGVGYGADIGGMAAWSDDEIFMTHHMMFHGHHGGLVSPPNFDAVSY